MKPSLCLIGCGAHAKSVYAPALRRIAGGEGRAVLAACCDLSPAEAEAMRREAGFARACTDWRQMMERERPDAVIAVLPYTVAEQVAVPLLEAGMPLLLEKPPGDSADACRRIARAAERGGAAHQIAFNRHYMPMVRHMREELRRPGAKPIQHIDYAMMRVNRTEPYFFVTAIHGIDLVAHLAGSAYRDVRFRYQMLPDLGDNHYNIYMDCDFASGATAQLRFLVQSGMVTERITVTRADESFCAYLPMWHGCDTPGCLERYRAGETVERISGGELSGGALFEDNGFYDEICAFLACVGGGARPPETAASCLQAMELAECVRHRLTEYHG